ncbi:MAG: hypothetical protein M3Y07_02750, partial [Acidobacteriota bacterium]|nr:hypothetical protein [Acidobacteriota bacterium]
NFDEAIAVSVKLLARTPSDVHALAQVAIEYWGKAEIAGHNLRLHESGELLTKCVEIWRQVTQRCPRDVDLGRQSNADAQKLADLRASGVTFH